MYVSQIFVLNLGVLSTREKSIHILNHDCTCLGACHPSALNVVVSTSTEDKNLCDPQIVSLDVIRWITPRQRNLSCVFAATTITTPLNSQTPSFNCNMIAPSPVLFNKQTLNVEQYCPTQPLERSKRSKPGHFNC